MRSARYHILPRAQYRSAIGLWVYVWRDPGNLVQRRGEPLNFVREYAGIGATFEEAVNCCRMKYIQDQHGREIARWSRESFEREYPHTIATTNLPWWKRLFRL